MQVRKHDITRRSNMTKIEVILSQNCVQLSEAARDDFFSKIYFIKGNENLQ